jgi:hypothetical protein
MTADVYCHVFIAYMQYIEEGNYGTATAKLLSRFYRLLYFLSKALGFGILSAVQSSQKTKARGPNTESAFDYIT